MTVTNERNSDHHATRIENPSIESFNEDPLLIHSLEEKSPSYSSLYPLSPQVYINPLRGNSLY